MQREIMWLKDIKIGVLKKQTATSSNSLAPNSKKNNDIIDLIKGVLFGLLFILKTKQTIQQETITFAKNYCNATFIKFFIYRKKYKYTFKYEATPNFIFETTTEDSSIDNHKKFINMLVESSKIFKPTVYVKPI
jgi:hypothetical protein